MPGQGPSSTDRLSVQLLELKADAAMLSRPAPDEVEWDEMDTVAGRRVSWSLVTSVCEPSRFHIGVGQSTPALRTEHVSRRCSHLPKVTAGFQEAWCEIAGIESPAVHSYFRSGRVLH